jgi:hypothetical protein
MIYGLALSFLSVSWGYHGRRAPRDPIGLYEAEIENRTQPKGEE